MKQELKSVVTPETTVKPFGVEYLEPLQGEVRGGMDPGECCVTLIADNDPNSEAGYACGDSDSCV